MKIGSFTLKYIPITCVVFLLCFIVSSCKSNEGKSPELTEEQKALFLKADSLRKAGNWKEEQDILDSIRRKTRNVSTRLFLAANYFYIESLQFQHNFSEMLDAIEEQLNTDKPDSLIFYDGLAYIHLYDFYNMYGRNEKARHYTTESDKIAALCEKSGVNESNKNDLKSLVLFQQIQNALMDNDTVLARNLINEKKKYHDGSPTAIASTEALSASRAFVMKDTAEGLRIYQKIIRDSTVMIQLRTDILYNMMSIFLHNGEVDSAIKWRDRYPVIYSKQNQREQFLMESRVQEAKGDSKNALIAYKQYKQLEDSVRSAFEEAYARDIGDRFEIRHRDRLLNAEHKSNFRKTSFIVILSLGLVTLGIITWLLRKRYKQKCISHNITKKTLGDRTGDMSALSSALQEALNREKELKAIEKSNISDSEKMSRIRDLYKFADTTEPRHLSAGLSDPAIPELLTRLRLVHPELTDSELRVAPMVMMNWSDKDIATQLNRSPNTIKWTKYCLKKKIGNKEKTRTYLCKLLAADPEELKTFGNK